MNGFRAFLKRKNIEFSAKRYGVDALGAMAQGLFCTLLVGTILNTLGTQFHIGFLSATVVTVGTGETATAYTIGGLASARVGPASAALGPVFPGAGGLCDQYSGRSGRPSGCFGHRHYCR